MRLLAFCSRGPSSSKPDQNAALPPISRGLISPGGSRWTNRSRRWLGNADVENGLVLLSPHPTQAGCWCSCSAQRPNVSLSWCRSRARSCNGLGPRMRNQAIALQLRERSMTPSNRHLAGILTTANSCDLTRALQAKISRARDQLLTVLDHPGRVEVTNNACERALRPAVVQRKVTNGYRAMWAAEGEAAVRTVVDTARLTPGTSVFGAILRAVTT